MASTGVRIGRSTRAPIGEPAARRTGRRGCRCSQHPTSCLLTADASEQALHRDHAVEAAGPEAFEVQGDELEAQGAEGGDQLAADIQVHQAGQVVEGDLDAGQVALVVADPQDAQALCRSHCSAWSIMRTRSGETSSP